MLVTAGSRGIGAATAKKLGAEGCDVAINYASNQEAAKKIAQDIVGCGSKAIILKGVRVLFVLRSFEAKISRSGCRKFS